MKACCLAGSSLRDIASGLRCSSPRRCTSAISPERLSETTPNSCSIHAPGRPRQGVADPRLQRHLLLQGQLAGATPVLEAGQTIDPVRLEKPVPRPDRIVVDQQHPTNILAAHPAIQQHQRVRPTGQTMLSQPVPSQLGQVLPFLRCQKAAANHGAEKNPSVPVWQAVFSTSHRVAVYSARPSPLPWALSKGLFFYRSSWEYTFTAPGQDATPCPADRLPSGCRRAGRSGGDPGRPGHGRRDGSQRPAEGRPMSAWSGPTIRPIPPARPDWRPDRATARHGPAACAPDAL